MFRVSESPSRKWGEEATLEVTPPTTTFRGATGGSGHLQPHYRAHQLQRTKLRNRA